MDKFAKIIVTSYKKLIKTYFTSENKYIMNQCKKHLSILAKIRRGNKYYYSAMLLGKCDPADSLNLRSIIINAGSP